MLFRSNGNGTFAPYSPLPRGNIDFSTPLSSTNAHILHGDFKGDGKQDIIAIGSSSIYQYDSYILFGHGDGTFDPPLLIARDMTDKGRKISERRVRQIITKLGLRKTETS